MFGKEFDFFEFSISVRGRSLRIQLETSIQILSDVWNPARPHRTEGMSVYIELNFSCDSN